MGCQGGRRCDKKSFRHFKIIEMVKRTSTGCRYLNLKDMQGIANLPSLDAVKSKCMK